MIMTQEMFLDVLKRAKEEVDGVCLVATLTAPKGEAIPWKCAKVFYKHFFMVAGFVSQSASGAIVGGISESHYETACIVAGELRKLPNVTIILDPQDDPSDLLDPRP